MPPLAKGAARSARGFCQGLPNLMRSDLARCLSVGLALIRITTFTSAVATRQGLLSLATAPTRRLPRPAFPVPSNGRNGLLTL